MSPSTRRAARGLRSLGLGLTPTLQDVLHVIRATLAHMANLTLTIDEDVLRRARIRALEEDTSVNALVRTYLQSYAGTSEAERAVEEVLELARRSNASSGPEGRTWTREDLYEERLGRYGTR